jgi:hypothetical protein
MVKYRMMECVKMTSRSIGIVNFIHFLTKKTMSTRRLNLSHSSKPSPATPVNPAINQKNEEELKSLRQAFRNLHDLFSETDIAETEGRLGVVVGNIGGAFGALENTMKLSELNIKSEEKWEQEVLEVLKSLSVADAVGFCQALANGIQHHKQKQFIDKKLKDLEITLL